jgi:hypothetical protein
VATEAAVNQLLLMFLPACKTIIVSAPHVVRKFKTVAGDSRMLLQQFIERSCATSV